MTTFLNTDKWLCGVVFKVITLKVFSAGLQTARFPLTLLSLHLWICEGGASRTGAQNKPADFEGLNPLFRSTCRRSLSGRRDDPALAGFRRIGRLAGFRSASNFMQTVHMEQDLV